MLDLVKYLQSHHTVQIINRAISWEQAVSYCFSPMLKNGSITEAYVNQVLKQAPTTDALVPDKKLLILSNPNYEHVNRDGLCFLISNEPILFADTKLKIIVGIVASNDQNYLNSLLPQVVSLFESRKIVEKILAAKTVDQIIDIFRRCDYQKHIKKLS